LPVSYWTADQIAFCYHEEHEEHEETAEERKKDETFGSEKRGDELTKTDISAAPSGVVKTGAQAS